MINSCRDPFCNIKREPNRSDSLKYTSVRTYTPISRYTIPQMLQKCNGQMFHACRKVWMDDDGSYRWIDGITIRCGDALEFADECFDLCFGHMQEF